jgi:hypothetical protein
MLKEDAEWTRPTMTDRRNYQRIYMLDMAQLKKELREVKSIEIGQPHELLHRNPGNQQIPRIMNRELTARMHIEPA